MKFGPLVSKALAIALVLLSCSPQKTADAASVTSGEDSSVCYTKEQANRVSNERAELSDSAPLEEDPVQSSSTVGVCGPGDILCRTLSSRFGAFIAKHLPPHSKPSGGFGPWKRPAPTPIESCSAEDLSCPSGLICAETSVGLRCVTPLESGEQCIHPASSVCGPGLECLKNRCVPVLAEGEACVIGNVQQRCALGTICGGRAGTKCLVPRKVGQVCGTNPNWICEQGVTCQHYRCMERVRVGEVCDDVDRPHLLCEQNSVCVLQGSTRRCTTLQRPDPNQWALVAANEAAWIFVNGKFVGDVHGWQHYAAVNITLKLGDVLAMVVKGDAQWSGFVAAVGAYQVGRPAWSIRTGAHEFLATPAFQDDHATWMNPDYDACHWKRARYANGNGADIGSGKAKNFPYWTQARYLWARDTAHGELIYVRFKRGGHGC